MLFVCALLINRNMRCIEILPVDSNTIQIHWLIETWDVLKYAFNNGHSPKSVINRNMRCIEIYTASYRRFQRPWLIETWDVLKWCKIAVFAEKIQRLIETWDVLKYFCYFHKCVQWIRLIETWDVLKLPTFNVAIILSKINRNMRCIEIRQSVCSFPKILWLIETWDVLK